MLRIAKIISKDDYIIEHLRIGVMFLFEKSFHLFEFVCFLGILFSDLE